MRHPDLYDYGKRDGDNKDSNGMGMLCLMSSGSHLTPPMKLSILKPKNIRNS
jgi:hypothetical protein